MITLTELQEQRNRHQEGYRSWPPTHNGIFFAIARNSYNITCTNEGCQVFLKRLGAARARDQAIEDAAATREYANKVVSQQNQALDRAREHASSILQGIARYEGAPWSGVRAELRQLIDELG